ncbi:uncharacterized protein LOC136033158 isoform X2 [Artemia franciscana]|uniref:uncharacterized protein LOC136033158 isoform X2 n=1 Tax=Artemia franciscana TaxID=6661 RepID=UPI0032DA10C0
MSFLRVEFPDSEQTMELPLENDDTLLLTTLKSNFPNANGLSYYCKSARSTRGLRLSEGKFLPPQEGWLKPNIRTYKILCAKAKNNTYPDLMQTGGSGFHKSLGPGKGMFIRVTEVEFSGERCYLDGINAKQSNDLQAKLLLLQSDQIQIMEGDVDNFWQVKGITALQLMSFLHEHYEAKIVAYSSNVKQVSKWNRKVARGTTSWTLESLKI